MNQNENKPLTAEEILDNLYRYVNKDINDDAAWDIAMQQIEQYAAQHVKGKEAEWITSARLAVNEGVAHYAQQVKQVTEERDKLLYSNEILAKAYHRLTSERDNAVELLSRCSKVHLPEVLQDEVDDFLNSINAAKEGGHNG